MELKVDDGVTCAILADRHAALAERLRHLLRTVTGSVFLVGDNESLMDGARRLRPGLVIVDLGFAEDGTTELLHRIKAEVPECRVIVLSLHDDPSIARATLAEGANAVVLKAEIAEELLDAVDTVMSGRTFVSPSFNVANQADAV